MYIYIIIYTVYIFIYTLWTQMPSQMKLDPPNHIQITFSKDISAP